MPFPVPGTPWPDRRIFIKGVLLPRTAEGHASLPRHRQAARQQGRPRPAASAPGQGGSPSSSVRAIAAPSTTGRSAVRGARSTWRAPPSTSPCRPMGAGIRADHTCLRARAGWICSGCLRYRTGCRSSVQRRSVAGVKAIEAHEGYGFPYGDASDDRLRARQGAPNSLA